ncbi:MAG TPA: acetoin utilization AcuC family protein [Candidatus Limnocylindrales bacterium]
MPADTGPLLVFGPNSLRYDFGPAHPLTPRRFGPGIDLLVHVGARPGLAPEPASDADLLRCHTAAYLRTVKRFSTDPWGPPEAGIGPGGDNPSFAGMHDAGAAVAGGSLRAIEAILRGDAEHAFHPGGGLHHAMPDRASGFCIYDDPALAIARARQDGLRVLYLDFDVHHGDGVEAIHAGDPGVMTVSFHESGRYLFPGTGFLDDLGEGEAAGTSLNIVIEPPSGESAWLAAVRRIVPWVAAAFGPDVVVSQHGADSHAWDPLAHLMVTTTAMGEAARIVDRVAHRWASGRWLATGGGGYDAYRVVPRTWSLVWLAGAHRDVPSSTPAAWRERWADEASRHGQAPLPETFEDPPNAGADVGRQQLAAEHATVTGLDLAELVAVPALLRAARRRGGWDPDRRAGAGPPAGAGSRAGEPSVRPTIVDPLGPEALSRLAIAPRVVPPADSVAVHELLLASLLDGATAVAAVADDTAVGVAIAGPADTERPRELLALGVAPGHRRRGLGSRLLEALAARVDGPLEATVSVAERDSVEPLDRGLRTSIARRLFERAGFSLADADRRLVRVDQGAVHAIRHRPGS